MPPDHPSIDDALTAGLATLATGGPPGLLERIAAGWMRAPGPTCDLYIAATHRGIVYVRTSHAVHDDPAEFATLFHRRFAQPLRVNAESTADHLAASRFDLSGLSDFEREVLLAVLTIPRGQLRPHDWIARRTSRPNASQAIDAVLVDNPIPVLIPSHRVIQADGTLGEHGLAAVVTSALLDAEGTNLAEVYELAQLDIHYLASDLTRNVCFPTCPQVGAAGSGHRRGFATVVAAERAGYRVCPACQPEHDKAG
jgi:O-6-methylguanine DNA methyltransferase